MGKLAGLSYRPKVTQYVVEPGIGPSTALTTVLCWKVVPHTIFFPPGCFIVEETIISQCYLPLKTDLYNEERLICKFFDKIYKGLNIAIRILNFLCFSPSQAKFWKGRMISGVDHKVQSQYYFHLWARCKDSWGADKSVEGYRLLHLIKDKPLAPLAAMALASPWLAFGQRREGSSLLSWTSAATPSPQVPVLGGDHSLPSHSCQDTGGCSQFLPLLLYFGHHASNVFLIPCLIYTATPECEPIGWAGQPSRHLYNPLTQWPAWPRHSAELSHSTA